MNYINQFRGLPRQVYYICLARMIIGIGSMIFMFFSLLLTQVLGFTEFQAGMAFIVICFCTVTGSVLGGKLADYYGRKKVYMTCIAITSILYGLTAFVAGSRTMIPLLFLASLVGSGSFPILSAMVADSAPANQRTECFSLLYLAQNLGFAFGPSLGGLLFYSHMDILFIVQAALFMLGGIFLYSTTTDIYSLGVSNEFGMQEQTADVTKPEKVREMNTFRLLFSNKPLFAFIVALVFLTMCYQMITFMLPLQMTEIFGLELGSRYSGLIWTTNALSVVIGTPIIIGYTKKHHQLSTTAFATVLYCIGFGFYAFVNSLPLYYIAVFIWTTGEIMISTGAGVFIAENSPPTHLARFQSLYDMARSLGRGFGPPIFGFMLLSLSYRQAWIVDSIACLVIGACLYLIYKHEKAKSAGLQDQSL